MKRLKRKRADKDEPRGVAKGERSNGMEEGTKLKRLAWCYPGGKRMIGKSLERKHLKRKHGKPDNTSVLDRGVETIGGLGHMLAFNLAVEVRMRVKFWHHAKLAALWTQCRQEGPPGQAPCLVTFRKGHSKACAAVPAEFLANLMREVLELREQLRRAMETYEDDEM